MALYLHDTCHNSENVEQGTWIAIILGIFGGIFLLWVASKNKISEREEYEAEDDLDDWDQQDQLEDDEI